MVPNGSLVTLVFARKFIAHKVRIRKHTALENALLASISCPFMGKLNRGQLPGQYFCRGRDTSQPVAPRTNPYVQDCCIRLLPRTDSVEAHVRMRMQDLRT